MQSCCDNLEVFLSWSQANHTGYWFCSANSLLIFKIRPATEFLLLPEKFSPRCELLVCWITWNRLFSSLDFVSSFPSQVLSTLTSSRVSVCKELCDKVSFYYSVKYFTANCSYTKEIKHEVLLDTIRFSIQYISGTSCKINCNGKWGNNVVHQRMISANIYLVEISWKRTSFHLGYLKYAMNYLLRKAWSLKAVICVRNKHGLASHMQVCENFESVSLKIMILFDIW